MHLTDAGPMSTGAPSVVQVAVGSELTRGQGDGFADTCAQIAMGDFLKASFSRYLNSAYFPLS